MWRQWKPATQHTDDKYRRLCLQDAFIEKGIDEISYDDVTKWMVEATRRGSPGAVNRAFDRLRAVMSKARNGASDLRGAIRVTRSRPTPDGRWIAF
jgi:hypothetical protein